MIDSVVYIQFKKKKRIYLLKIIYLGSLYIILAIISRKKEEKNLLI